MIETIGYELGDLCNRDGCTGTIQEIKPDGGCSCFVSAPCSRCCTSTLYCDKCNYEETYHA